MKNLSSNLLKYVSILLLTLIISSCEKEEIYEDSSENLKVQDADNENSAFTSKCSIKGYIWLKNSPNKNNNWKLQYLGIEATKNSTSNKFSSVANSRFDVVGTSCNRLRFRVDKNDPTTGNSSYPRTELRERTKTNSSGKDRDAAWSYTSTKWMDIEFKVREIPSSGRLSVAQIHSRKDDISQILVRKLSNGKLKVSLIVEGSNGGVERTIYNNASTNTIFKIRMKIENNKVKARKLSNSSYLPSVTIKNSTTYRTSTCHFKVGTYLLGANSGKAKVEFYKIKTSGAQNY